MAAAYATENLGKARTHIMAGDIKTARKSLSDATEPMMHFEAQARIDLATDSSTR